MTVTTMNERHQALDAAHRHATAFLESLPTRPVWPRAPYEQMRTVFGRALPEEGSDAASVVEELATLAEPGIVGSAGSRFFGFVVGGSLPAALAVDWLTSTWDQNAGLSSMAPAAAAVEAVAGEWLVDLLGLPVGSSVGFVTGAMMSNFTCLAAARRQVLAKAGWDLDARGLRGAPATAVVVGAYRHDTIDRALRLLGIGSDEMVVVPTDAEGRMQPDALQKALSTTTGPVIVCLQAGEVHTGAFDPFRELIAAARRSDAWVHVDGAFGLWAAASPRTRHLVAGAAEADSWATDAHKTLNVPYDSGLAIVREDADLRAAFGVSADYLIAGEGDPLERTPEFSRRARGFAVWAALRSLGRQGVARLVEGLSVHASEMAAGLRETAGIEILNEVAFTQVVAAARDDETTRALGERLLEDGTAALTPGQWAGRAVLRCSVSNWSTTSADVKSTVQAVRRCLDEVQAVQSPAR
jgi:glutamate/tyrosine decarboxylase-like PLP-dependent enzyme